MSKGRPTEPRAPKLGGSERAVASLGPRGGPFGPLWASLGRLPSALLSRLPPRVLQVPCSVDDVLVDGA